MKGFTIIELLAVISIMVLIAALAAPSITGIMKGSQLTLGAQIVAEQLSLARQTALSSSRSVEVRFYQYGAPDMPGEQIASPNTGRYRAIQLFEILESGSSSALGKVHYLPSSIIIDSGSTLSSLLAPPASYAQPLPKTTAAGSQTLGIGRAGKNYNSVSFQYLPTGSIGLSPLTANPWFLTLHSVKDRDPANPAIVDGFNMAPPNFFTIQIDAINGHIKTFRP